MPSLVHLIVAVGLLAVAFALLGPSRPARAPAGSWPTVAVRAAAALTAWLAVLALLVGLLMLIGV